MMSADELAILDAMRGDLSGLASSAAGDARWHAALVFHQCLSGEAVEARWEWPEARPDAPSVHALVAGARAAA